MLTFNPLDGRGESMPLPFFTQSTPFGLSFSVRLFVPLPPNPGDATEYAQAMRVIKVNTVHYFFVFSMCKYTDAEEAHSNNF